jgi:hypothetical protein
MKTGFGRGHEFSGSTFYPLQRPVRGGGNSRYKVIHPGFADFNVGKPAGAKLNVAALVFMRKVFSVLNAIATPAV